MLQSFSSPILNQLLGMPYKKRYKVDLGADFLAMVTPYWLVFTIMSPALAVLGAACCAPIGWSGLIVLLLIVPTYASVNTLKYLTNPVSELIFLSNLSDATLFKSLVYAWFYRFRNLLLILAVIMPVMLSALNVLGAQPHEVLSGRSLNCFRSFMGNLYCAPIQIPRTINDTNWLLVLNFLVQAGPSAAVISTVIISLLCAVAFTCRLRDTFQASIISSLIGIGVSVAFILLSNELFCYLNGDASPALAKIPVSLALSLVYVLIAIILVEGIYRYGMRWVRSPQ